MKVKCNHGIVKRFVFKQLTFLKVALILDFFLLVAEYEIGLPQETQGGTDMKITNVFYQ